MAKVLLVLENYSELAYCETLLKKVGIDVQGSQNDLAVPELIMTFLPDLVIANAHGRRVNGLRVAGKLLHAPSIIPIVLLAADTGSIPVEDQQNFNISAILSQPIEPQKFLSTVAEILGLDIGVLVKKSERTLGQQAEESNQWVKSVNPSAEEISSANISGDGAPTEVRFPISLSPVEMHPSGSPSSVEDENTRVSRILPPLNSKTLKETTSIAKSERYAKIISELPPPTQNGLQRSLVSDQIREFRKAESDPEIQEIDAERLQFTASLYEQAQADQAQHKKSQISSLGGNSKKSNEPKS